LPQELRSRVRATGILTGATPRMLVLSAVHRQTAASKSAKPLMSEQHSWLGGVPMTSLTRPNQLPHTPNLSVSLGHFVVACFAGGGGHGLTVAPGVTWPKKNVMLRSSKMRRDRKAFEIPIRFILKLVLCDTYEEEERP